jgi:hypothetical protein
MPRGDPFPIGKTRNGGETLWESRLGHKEKRRIVRTSTWVSFVLTSYTDAAWARLSRCDGTTLTPGKKRLYIYLMSGSRCLTPS